MTSGHHASPSFTIFWSLLKFMSVELVMLSNHLILCCLLLLSSIFPSIRIFPMSQLFTNRWPKNWRFSFSISPSMNIQGQFPLGLTGLIFLQSRGLSRVFSSTTIWKHQFFSVQPSLWSNSHRTTGETTALTIWTFGSKGMSLLFNTLSSLVIAFLPKSKCLNIMAAVTVHNDFDTQEKKIYHCFHFAPFYLP